MSDYESITGKRVKFLTSDPTLESSYEGQVWYNSTTGVNKSLVQVKAWSSGGNLGTSRRYISGCGTQASIVAFGGFKPGAGNETELYNGFSWSEVNNLGTAAYSKGAAGTQTAALAFGGSPAVCESWDGSSWTSSPAMNNGQRNFGSCGIQTAALAFGGRPEPSVIAKTEEWNGTAWSEQNDLNNGVRNNMGSGIQTAALNSGGYSDPNGAMSAVTEEYNGTSWTTSPGTMNTARMASATNTGGLQTAALIYGGNPPASDATEMYDGTSWITQPSMATARGQTGGGGTATAAIVYGGSPPGSGGRNLTEEYNSNINAITQAAFASGGNLNTGRGYAGAATQGSQNSALHFGGWAPPGGARTAVEEYNGSSWSEVTDLGTAQYYVAGAGTQTAALGFGGYTTPPAAISAKTVEYDGSSWTNGGNLNNARTGPAGAGTQTAGLAMGGGNATPLKTAVEEYNGSAWTNVNAKSNPTPSAAATGIQTAALSLGGSTVATELYDGTNWTSGGNMNVIRNSISSATGTQTLGLIAKGNLPPGDNLITNTEKFDGTTFATSASVTTGAQYACGTGATIGGVIHGGGTPLAGTNSTEEFTDGTETITASTLTTS